MNEISELVNKNNGKLQYLYLDNNSFIQVLSS